MNEFLAYRAAYDDMQSDAQVLDTRDRIKELQDQLFQLEAPYRARMAEAEVVIRAAVLKQAKSVTLHDVYARYISGRRSTSWKSVAEEMKAPEDVIEKHTKVGEAKVTVEVV